MNKPLFLFVSHKAVIRVGMLLIWLGAVFWLVRFEAHPEWFTHSLPGYDGLIGRDLLVSDTWMQVLNNGKPVGYSMTSIDVDDQEQRRHVVFENRTHVRIDVMGSSQLIRAMGTAYLDMSYRLQEFEFSLKTDVLDVDIKGTRDHDDVFDLAITTASQTRHTSVTIPDDLIIYAPMTAMAVRNLDVGEYLNINTFNPITLGKETATIRAVGRETIRIDNAPVEAIHLEVDYMNSQSQAWIDSDGNLLRQETPLGWTLERSSPDRMFKETSITP